MIRSASLERRHRCRPEDTSTYLPYLPISRYISHGHRCRSEDIISRRSTREAKAYSCSRSAATWLGLGVELGVELGVGLELGLGLELALGLKVALGLGLG